MKLDTSTYFIHVSTFYPRTDAQLDKSCHLGLLTPDCQTSQRSPKHFKKQCSSGNDQFNRYLLKDSDDKGMLSFEVRSEINRLHQSSTGELANWDQEISFDRSNILGLEKCESGSLIMESSSQG